MHRSHSGFRAHVHVHVQTAQIILPLATQSLNDEINMGEELGLSQTYKDGSRSTANMPSRWALRWANIGEVLDCFNTLIVAVTSLVPRLSLKKGFTLFVLQATKASVGLL